MAAVEFVIKVMLAASSQHHLSSCIFYFPLPKSIIICNEFKHVLAYSVWIEDDWATTVFWIQDGKLNGCLHIFNIG